MKGRLLAKAQPVVKPEGTTMLALTSGQHGATLATSAELPDLRLVQMAQLLGQEAAKQAWRDRHRGFGLIEVAAAVGLIAAALAILLDQLS